MKKLLSILSLLTVAVGCQKDNLFNSTTEDSSPITITVGKGEEISRIAISENSSGVWNTAWEDGDILAGVRSGKSKVEKFTISDIDVTGKSAKFSGEASKDSYMRLIYPYKSGTVYETEDLYPIDLTSQSCDLSNPFSSLSKNGLIMATNLFHVESNLVVTDAVTVKHLAVGGELVITPTSAVTGENYTLTKVIISGENILSKGTIDIAAEDALFDAENDTITISVTSSEILKSGTSVSIPFAMAPTTLDSEVTVTMVVTGDDLRDKSITVLKSAPSPAITLAAGTHVTLNVEFDQTAIAVATPWDGAYPDSEVGELELSDFEHISATSIKTIYIDTPWDLAKFAEYVERGANTSSTTSGSVGSGLTVILRNDLDMNSMPFHPIGASYTNGSFTSAQYFVGTFDGNGHTISNLKISGDKTYFPNLGTLTAYALFARLNTATIKDLTLDKLNISSSTYNDCAAGIANYVQKKVLIQNCNITNSTLYIASGNNNCLVGGFIGNAGQGTDMVNCTISNSKLTGGTVGGLAARPAYKGAFIGCTSSNNTIVGTGIAGGLVGEANYNASIEKNSTLSSSNECYFIACKVSGSVSAPKSGGLAGRNWGKIVGCYSKAIVSGTYCGTVMGEQSVYSDVLTSSLTPAVNNLKKSPYNYACYGLEPATNKFSIAYSKSFDSQSVSTELTATDAVNNYDNALSVDYELSLLEDTYNVSITRHNTITANRSLTPASGEISASEVEYMNNAIKDVAGNYPFFQDHTSATGCNEAPDNTLRETYYKYQFVVNSGSDSDTFPYIAEYVD